MARLPLTDRQRQILRLSMHGLGDKAIARGCGIGRATVRNHLNDAYARLGLPRCYTNNRTRACVALYREEFGARGARGQE